MDASVFLIACIILAIPVILLGAVIKIYNLGKRIEKLEAALLSTEQPLHQKTKEMAAQTPPVIKEKTETPTTKKPTPTIPQIKPQPKQKQNTLPPKETIESQLGSKWLVWVGGLALIFGGVFLVNYSIENGLLGPWGRITSGLVFGLIMLGAGEWFRRQPTDSKYTSAWPHIPLALTSAAIITLFGAVYAGYALYNLFPPAIAFGLLAVVSIATVIIAVLHGPLLGLLGVIGAYSVPMLISSSDPSIIILFSYLFLFCTASLALFRYMKWKNMAWANLIGSLSWAAIGMTGFALSDGNSLAIGLYLLATLCLFILYAWDCTETKNDGSLTDQIRQKLLHPPYQVSLIATIAISFLMVIFTIDAAHSAISLFFVCCLAIGLLVIARLNGNLIDFIFISLIVILTTLLSWDFSNEILVKTPRFLGTDIPFGFNPEIIIPDGYELFLTLGLAASLIHLVVGAFFTCTHTNAGRWALLSVLSPLLIFILSYWKINGLQTIPTWSFIALGIGLVFTLLAHHVSRQAKTDIQKHALAAYIVGGFAAVALAFGAGLESHWLAISLSLLLPAMAWVNSKIPLDALKWFAYPMIIFVLGQLLLEGHLWAFMSDNYKAVDWYLYGYGLPALSLALASYIYGKERPSHLISLLEAGALSCWITTLSLMVHDFADIALNQPGYSFAEQSMQSVIWLMNSLGIFWLNKRYPSRIRNFAWRLLLLISACQVILSQVLLHNPWFMVPSPIGNWPFFNWLFVAYVIPAVFAFIFARIFKEKDQQKYARFAGVASFALLFIYVSMEIHHWFAGPNLQSVTISETELYIYSLVWLLCAGGLMALAIRYQQADMQKGAMAVLVLTVFKVFIYDMAHLEGLLRAISFLGLGGILIGVGYIYQRYIVKPTS
ncbi:DUF2339 domain-containing protein [Terasakiella sp. A23]|uniref:DUF2339 domain-containing protein n=1 Tax=Terasakiella sp. FCG-A23 TaxID=3080561 RepID=UPI00295526AE|nr:DUF2339 domain-containing protein [Terasakiella sp. A23]MDV7338554.1 DUF2339 domain-containing protein [Terasakiella sp. A23]